MSDQEQAELRMMVARLRHEHEDFDAAINAMIQVGCDQLRIQRMKKKKLADAGISAHRAFPALQFY